MPSQPAVITVDHEELTGSPSEQITEDGRTVTRELLCNWDDRHTLFRQLLGRRVAIDSESGIQQITNPDTFDEDDGYLTRISARSVTIEPFGTKTLKADSLGRVAAYLKAKLTVEYATGIFDQDEGGGGGGSTDQPDIIIEESMEPEAENLNISRDDLVWGSDSGPSIPVGPTEIPGKVQISLGWVVTYLNVLDPIPDAFFDILGFVNQFKIVSRRFGKTWDIDTLLYSSVNMRRGFTTEGATSWTLTARFSRRVNQSGLSSAINGEGGAALGILGWNGLWRATKGDYDVLATQTSSSDPTPNDRVDIYQRANFGNLLLTLG